MALQAQFRHGDPLMVDYTPTAADVAAGDVVVIGDLACIAHQKITKNTLGAVAAGGGVYRVTADGALSAGVKVYWDDTANKVTATSTNNKVFGYVAPNNAASADGDQIDVIHAPEAA